jgi:hypothetical protein
MLSYEEENKIASNIALADIALLLTYMYKYSDDISKNKESLD